MQTEERKRCCDCCDADAQCCKETCCCDTDTDR